MKKYMTIVVIAISLLTVTADAGSLFINGVEKGDEWSPYTRKVVARKKHDLISIMIIEQSSASRDGKTAMDKNSSLSASVSDWFRFDWGKKKFDTVNADKLPSAAFDASKTHDADASVEASGTFTAQITAEIVEILPNGNLVLEAKKDIKINEDIQTITMTGIAASRDILANNSVLSSKVANAKIEYTGKGPITDAQRRGLFSKFVDFIWPF